MAAAAPAQAIAPGQPQLRVTSLPQLVALAMEKRDIQLKMALESDVRLVRIEDGRLEIALEPHASRGLPQDLSRKLELWTGRRWAVVVSNEAGQATLRDQNTAQKEELTRGVVSDPRVQAVLKLFPGTNVEVRRIAPVDMPEELPIESDNDDDTN
jgi:DNA polymerase-3 subunit gamma/tau